jgi:crotonobetainyl-CoA:carnitine CoA-transferase CaiB-like acyl-CoA transferase
MRRPGWLEPGVFKTHDERGARQDELDELIAGWTAERTSGEVLALMEEHGVPAGLIYRTPEMLTDPQFIAREAIVDVPHPTLGTVKMQNVFPRLSDTPGGVNWPGPPLGGHNDEIYRERLGLSEAEIRALTERGVV